MKFLVADMFGPVAVVSQMGLTAHGRPSSRIPRLCERTSGVELQQLSVFINTFRYINYVKEYAKLNLSDYQLYQAAGTLLTEEAVGSYHMEFVTTLANYCQLVGPKGFVFFWL